MVTLSLRFVALLALLIPPGAAGAEPLQLHFISGSKEYGSEPSLKAYQEHLEATYEIEVTASWVRDGAKELPGIAHIADCDLLLVFARRMKLPEEQMAVIRGHWQAGRPVVGIRTASHAFQKDDNAIFDREVLGGNYTGHYGNEAVAVRTAEDAGEHAVLEGVGEIVSRKLYKAGELAEGAVTLQVGEAAGRKDSENAVTWVNEYRGGRMFYTSLGVPSDFEDGDFIRLLDNAIFWTLGKQAGEYRK